MLIMMDDKLAQLTALQETTRAMVSTLELDELLDLIVSPGSYPPGCRGRHLEPVAWQRREDEVYAYPGSFMERVESAAV